MNIRKANYRAALSTLIRRLDEQNIADHLTPEQTVHRQGAHALGAEIIKLLDGRDMTEIMIGMAMAVAVVDLSSPHSNSGTRPLEYLLTGTKTYANVLLAEEDIEVPLVH